jgi:hypothetical protein
MKRGGLELPITSVQTRTMYGAIKFYYSVELNSIVSIICKVYDICTEFSPLLSIINLRRRIY